MWRWTLLLLALAACTEAPSATPLPSPATCSGVDLNSDPNHCGACGYVCPHVAGAEASCQAGACVQECLGGRADCNQDLALPRTDGCEVVLAEDANNCGECGVVCEAGALPQVKAECHQGGCGLGCNDGYADCNLDLLGAESNGCEVDFRSNPDHCGTCRHACDNGCVDGGCLGEAPICQLYPSEAPRPVSVKAAASSQGFLLAWNDFNNHGLWVAARDGRGRSMGAPLRIATVESWADFDLGFNGREYVLVYADSTAQAVLAQPIDGAGALLGSPIRVVEDVVTPLVQVAEGPGEVLILSGASAAILGQGATAVISIPSPAEGNLAVVAHTDGGYLLAWTVREIVENGSEVYRLYSSVIGPDGAVRRPAEPVDAALHLGSTTVLMLTPLGSGALLLVNGGALGGPPLVRTTVFDANGMPLAWRAPFPTEALGLIDLSSYGGRAWATVTKNAPNGLSLNDLQVYGLDPVGSWVAPPLRGGTLTPGFQRLATAAGPEGLLLAWGFRSAAGGPDVFRLQASFVDSDGTNADPCQP